MMLTTIHMISSTRLKTTIVKILFIVFFLQKFIDGSDSPSLDQPFQGSSFQKVEHDACVTLFWKKGRIGCGTTSRSSQSGEVMYWSNLIVNGNNDDSSKNYIAVFSEVDYTLENVEQVLDTSENVMGALVLNSTSFNESYIKKNPSSVYPHGTDTPEEYVTLYGDVEWNTYGDGLMYEDNYGLPMAFVSDAKLSSYLHSVSQSDQTDGSVTAEFNYYMGGPNITSEECLSWKDTDGNWKPKCLPLGGQSIWAKLFDDEDDNEDDGNSKEMVWLTTSIDATSMFHTSVRGSKTAASNILTLLLTAMLLGELEDASLSKNIGFAFFQGESYGYLGSRSFWKDVYVEFYCENYANDTACLFPLRPSLEFTKLSSISNIIAIDQVGYLMEEGSLFTHGTGGFTDEVLLALSSDDLLVQESSAEDENGDSPIPPSPLNSALVLLGEDAIDGSVLTGFDDSFSSSYMSHLDLPDDVDLDSICNTATLLARAALALAYDDGSQDSESAAEYALELIPDQLQASNDTVQILSECLFYNGECDLFLTYSYVERNNNVAKTGVDVGMGSALGNPPNYYVNVLDVRNSQPFVLASGNYYGAYNKSNFGGTSSDTIILSPSVLETSIKGLLDHFLTYTQSDISCKSLKDCSELQCSSEHSATCTGAHVCTCPKANYHIALDTNLQAAPDQYIGKYSIIEQDDDENEISTPIYTEPYWSNSVGVTIYRKMDSSIGYYVLGFGVFLGISSVVIAIFGRKLLYLNKLY